MSKEGSTTSKLGMRPPGPTLDNPENSSTAVPARPHRARSTGRAIPKGGEIP
ncbi:predicted protein [Botrytis cinerea T4]|uniref:Uncharacterized protein n=1 Tax=Botryotinia fuckeliana (strain T4) TaxID=999810 RepID=G2XW33_BOTF4|nr:predicted protein [Botrytis cinerea T4]